MTMRYIVPLVLALALAVTMASCGSGPPVTEVRYLNQETDPAVVAIQRRWIERFVGANPGIRVAMENAPNINQRIATYVQAGARMDVIHADGGSAAMLTAGGLLAPLDDVVERLGGRESFLPGRLLIVEGRVYAINQAATAPVLHYRKDLFAAAGLQPPTTWDELMNAARTLHRADTAGIALPAGENRATTIYSGIFLWQNCGDFFNSQLEVTLDNVRTHEALRFYADLLKFAPPDAGAWGFTEPIESFWSGRSAMVYHWHGLDLTFRQNPALIDNIGVVPVPRGRLRVTEQGGRYIAVLAASPVVELAKKWVEHVFSGAQARELTELQPMLYPPITRQALADLRHSTAPTVQTYGGQLFNVVYTSSEFAHNQIFNGGGVNPETCALQATGVLNPYVSVLWNSNLYARAVQRVAYESWEPARAAAAAQTALAQQVETARRELGGRAQ
jgi:ABC-type glycerol-3-phosphate transport system substrate-binding protein